MKNTLYILLSLLPLLACNPSSKINLDEYAPEKHLAKGEINEFKYSLIRHLGKLHKKATHENKFDNFFNEYYHELAQKHELVYYVPQHTDSFTYFCAVRIAPSVTVKKVAIAGRIKTDTNGNLTHYEELYRTWKMTPDNLKEKNDLLFAKLLAGEDLSPYYNHNSGEEEWIEFPDKDVFFDTEQKQWIREGKEIVF